MALVRMKSASQDDINHSHLHVTTYRLYFIKLKTFIDNKIKIILLHIK